KDLTNEDRVALRERGVALKDEVAQLDKRVGELEERLHELELWVPNIPDESVPVGKTEEDNVVRWSWDTPREFSFEPKSHADLGEALGIFDPSDAVRMSGTRFYALKGLAAR